MLYAIKNKGVMIMINIVKEILLSVLGYLKADWLILLIGIIIAVSMNVYIDSNKLKKLMTKKTGISIPGAVLFGALTPLCACGTMAVLFAMFVSAMPWGPVMAFLISSPLTSPSEYIFETAFFGSKFATAVLISSILLGFLAGIAAHLIDKKTNFFKEQFRLNSSKDECCCTSSKKINIKESCCDTNKKKLLISKNTKLKAGKIQISNKISETKFKENKKIKGILKRYKLNKFAKEFLNIGIKKIFFYFVIFIAIGRIVELIIPQSIIMTLFSADKAYSIPLAATIGLPLYLNDSSALPVLKSLINSGAGQGVVLAFLITGKATGVPVVAGLATFIKKRAMLFYISFIFMGGILCGFIYQLIS